MSGSELLGLDLGSSLLVGELLCHRGLSSTGQSAPDCKQPASNEVVFRTSARGLESPGRNNCNENKHAKRQNPFTSAKRHAIPAFLTTALSASDLAVTRLAPRPIMS